MNDELASNPGNSPRKLGTVGELVHIKISSLQQGYLADRPAEVAALAILRRAAGTAPGAMPEAWEHTLSDMPLFDGNDSGLPSLGETAAHTAITLYAIHQQSRRARVHMRGHGLGQAARQLIDQGVSAEAVTRRFHAIGLANAAEARNYHLRALITQLRGGGGRSPIILDYGILADQLLWLQRPASADRVRLAWGREFVRTATNDRPEGPTPPTERETDR